MSRKTYPAALNEVLAPLGFKREGMVFSRAHGDLLEQVDLQVSQVAGVTANLWTKNLATEELHRQAVLGRPPMLRRMFIIRIGTLIDGYDRWWRGDPNGPAELAEAVRIHAPPYFDARRSLEAQALTLGRNEPRWRNSFERIYLALTLYQMGELDEACAALTNPAKALSPSDQAEVDGVRLWLGCPGVDAEPAAQGG
ncbi:MAG: DUF4304 domain-containing protein [Phenylobacterium sp.]|uniref:DUF4304 domain-containing protein n=1 Tax=Phenylobacterium sp. TaxID=1871053 RepID=UPI0027302897|nr:DUF4304 domain-containing protein [Phenylobacterium sp.]MDP2012233.1 DUF4304 domain-containing protein [Phenylobacterium sp.]